MKLHFRLLTNKYFFIGFIIILVGILTAINNYYFYAHVKRSTYRNANQLESILEDEIIFCRNKKNKISRERYRNNIKIIVKDFSQNAYYNDSIILKHESEGLLWKKPKYEWDKVVASHIKIIIPKLKSDNDLYFDVQTIYSNKIYFLSIIRSMTFSIFDKGMKFFSPTKVLVEQRRIFDELNKKYNKYKNLHKKYNKYLIKYYQNTLVEKNQYTKLKKEVKIYKLSKKEMDLYKKLGTKISKSEISKNDINTAWLRSRPAIGFTIFTIILIWLFRRREVEIAKTEQELEQEKKNKEILETTFGVKDQNEDIELYEAIMSKDISKLKKIKSINPTMNILKFNALIEHTEQEKLERLKILIEKGIDLTFKDDEGMTALMYYALGNKDDNQDSKIIELLIQEGLDIDAQNDSGMTALMLCAVKNRPASVQILVDNGADININQDLTAKELAATPEIRDIIGKVENHFPRKLVSFLSNFGNQDYDGKPSPMKDAVHEWDFNFHEKWKTFENFLFELKLQWDDIEKELYKLSPNLYAKIQNFLFKDKQSIKNWYSKNGNQLAIGWSSLDGLKEWCDKSNDPFKYELSQSYEINSGDINLFGEVIKLFKQEIQIRRESNILDTYFIDKEDELDQEYEFEIETINLEAKEFYTDTEKFIKVLDKIFKQFEDNNEFKKITVEIIEDKNGKYYDLKITQHNSFSGKSAIQLLKKINCGDFASIKENLTNLCDWSVESCHNKVSFRVNFLKSSNIADIENLEQKANGFTHIMRFYL